MEELFENFLKFVLTLFTVYSLLLFFRIKNYVYCVSITKNTKNFRGWWLYYCALATLNGAYTPLDWSTGYGNFSDVPINVFLGIFFVPNGGDEVIHPRTTYMKLRAVK